MKAPGRGGGFPPPPRLSYRPVASAARVASAGRGVTG